MGVNDALASYFMKALESAEEILKTDHYIDGEISIKLINAKTKLLSNLKTTSEGITKLHESYSSKLDARGVLIPLSDYLA